MELIYFISFIVVFVLLAFLYNRYKGKIIANKLSTVLGIKLSGTKGTAIWNGIKFEYDYDSGGEFYITADSTGFATSFFQSHERRKAIKDIFLSGCQEIVCNGKLISVRWVSLGYKIKYDYSAIPKVILNLAELTKGYTDTTYTI